MRTPSLVAKAVMENTDHHLLVGDGAQVFGAHHFAEGLELIAKVGLPEFQIGSHEVSGQAGIFACAAERQGESRWR